MTDREMKLLSDQPRAGLTRRKTTWPLSRLRNDAANAMLLNEFLKEHKTVQQQTVTIKRLQQQVEALSAGLQQVKAQVETTRLTQQVLASSQ